LTICPRGRLITALKALMAALSMARRAAVTPRLIEFGTKSWNRELR